MKRIFKKIVEKLSQIEDVKVVILYGSFARDENTSRSDIDLFIITAEDKTLKEVQDKIIELESEIGRIIQPTIRTINELQKTDTGLLQNIFQEGEVLYLREPQDIPSSILLQQRPYLIYSFQISRLSQKEKVRFNRQLYEQTRKGYRYKGFLQKIGGQKLSSGCIMIPHTEKSKIEKFFKKFKVDFEQLKVWK